MALFTRLNRHGLLQDIERRQGLLARTTGSLRDLGESLAAVTARLADPSLAADQRQHLQRQRNILEQQFHRRLPALEPRLVEPAEVAHALPADGVLFEFQRYGPRYLALVLRGETAPARWWISARSRATMGSMRKSGRPSPPPRVSGPVPQTPGSAWPSACSPRLGPTWREAAAGTSPRMGI